MQPEELIKNPEIFEMNDNDKVYIYILKENKDMLLLSFGVEDVIPEDVDDNEVIDMEDNEFFYNVPSDELKGGEEIVVEILSESDGNYMDGSIDDEDFVDEISYHYYRPIEEDMHGFSEKYYEIGIEDEKGFDLKKTASYVEGGSLEKDDYALFRRILTRIETGKAENDFYEPKELTNLSKISYNDLLRGWFME